MWTATARPPSPRKQEPLSDRSIARMCGPFSTASSFRLKTQKMTYQEGSVAGGEHFKHLDKSTQHWLRRKLKGS